MKTARVTRAQGAALGAAISCGQGAAA